MSARRIPDDFNEAAAPDEVEIASGAMPYLDFLRRAHKALCPRLYVEIGVRHGRSLALARCRAIGIDPNPEITVSLSDKTEIHPETSDHFFERDVFSALRGRIDLAFIDGMHLSEYALRDFMNIERHAHPASVVVFDDIFPNHPLQAERRRQSRVWTGDIWKIISCLRTHRPDLIALRIDTYPTGMLMVVGLDPGNRHIEEKYSGIVPNLVNEQTPPTEILERRCALQPGDSRISDMLRMLRKVRDSGKGSSSLAEQLRTWRASLDLREK